MRQKRIEIAGADHLETLRRCGGYYACPKDNGKRLGPLVGYAGRYNGLAGQKMQFVGDVYANFAKAEIHPNVLRFFAQNLFNRVEQVIGVANIDVLCGAPIGGYSLADALGSVMDVKTIKAEKEILALATVESREVSEIGFRRHDVLPDERVLIVEDVCNNFSTTDQIVGNILLRKGIVAGIVCFLNRSLTVNDVYEPGEMHKRDGTLLKEAVGLKLPVVSLVRKPISEWKQDDPAVADDIAKGNVVWKPKEKDDWARLMKAMSENTPPECI